MFAMSFRVHHLHVSLWPILGSSIFEKFLSIQFEFALESARNSSFCVPECQPSHLHISIQLAVRDTGNAAEFMR